MIGFAIFLGLFLAVTVMLFGASIVDAMRSPSEDAELVVRLLKDDPDGLLVDRYVAYHKGSGVGVWIANEAFGVEWWVGARDGWRDRGYLNTPAADRRYIWKHVRKIVRVSGHPDADALRKAVGGAPARADFKVVP